MELRFVRCLTTWVTRALIDIFEFLDPSFYPNMGFWILFTLGFKNHIFLVAGLFFQLPARVFHSPCVSFSVYIPEAELTFNIWWCVCSIIVRTRVPIRCVCLCACVLSIVRLMEHSAPLGSMSRTIERMHASTQTFTPYWNTRTHANETHASSNFESKFGFGNI